MAVTGRMGVQTLTSKKVFCLLSPQNPCALISSLASSCLFAVRSAMFSPERGCSPGWGTLLSGASPRDLWFHCVSRSWILHDCRSRHVPLWSCFPIHLSRAVNQASIQPHGIPECHLVQVKAMLIYRQDRQPVGCTLFSSQVGHSFGVLRELFQEQPGVICCCLSLLLPDRWPCLSLFLQCVWVKLPRLMENIICD